MTETRRTTCPFCLNGCESEVVFDYQYRMEYPRNAVVNGGRLCPRGSSASIVLDHPLRLSYPLLDGREVTWDRALGYCREAVSAARPDRLAVVFSRGPALDELRLIAGFAVAAGGRLACGYLEPGNAFSHRLDGVRGATLNDVRRAETTLLVGDVFSTSPVASGPILDARYADRKRRLVVVDSLRTAEAGFAHLFLHVRPGTEPFVLAAIAALLDSSLGSIDVAECAMAAGIERGMIEAAANMLKGRAVFIGSTMATGRNLLPRQHSLLSQLVALAANGTFTGFAEARVPAGTCTFEEVRRDCGEGRVRTLFWFGGLHPLSYPELFAEAARVEFRVATSIFRPAGSQPGLLLPVPTELEKDSIGESCWGEVVRRPLAGHWSGSRPAARFIADLGYASSVDFVTPKLIQPAEVVAAAARMRAADWPAEDLTLVGEKRAIGIGGFYDSEEKLGIGVRDAAGLGVVDGDRVVVRSISSSVELTAELRKALPDGVVTVGANRHANRALFPVAFGGDAPAIPPVAVGVARMPARTMEAGN